MSNFLKTSAVSLVAVLSVVTAMPASAQSMTADQIAAMIAQLQSQLAGLSGTSLACAVVTRNLTVGSVGSDVKDLQKFLNSHGAVVSASGAGSVGNESTYFGAKTKAAVAMWQAANGVSPASGYVGPLTRAAITRVCGNAGSGNGTGTGTGTGTGSGSGTVSATGLMVSLAATNPSAGALISSSNSAAARVPVLTLNFTAGASSAVTISDIKFHKNGVLADSSVSGAYLMENGRVITQYSSISSGVIDFASSWTIPAGQTRTITLAIDPATNLSAGNSVSFSLASANDITSMDAAGATVNETGSFPITGNIFTVTSVSNPSLATMTISSSSVGTQVYAGSKDVLVSAWTVSVANSPVNLGGINFRVIGSANKTDIANVKLFINGTQVGQTLATVNPDGTAFFDLSGSPARLSTGSSNIQVHADIMGSPSYSFQFEILNSYDVYAVDTQYSVPVSVTVNGGSGVSITIQQGQITVTADSNTPTGNVAKGASGVTLAKFDIYAAGESVRVKFLTLRVTATGDSVYNTFNNLYLVDDAGVQIGSTISTIATGTTSGTCDAPSVISGAANCYFGTSSSNINYTVPANTTRVISAKADIKSTTNATAVQATLPGDTSNLQGVTSSQSASSGAASGATLTIASTPLSAVKNTAFGNITIAKGTTAAKIGSFNLAASSAEGVNIYTITVTMATTSVNLQNLKITVGGVPFGTSRSTLSGSDVVTFSGSANVPAGSTKEVAVWADVLSSASAGTYTTLTTLTSCSGTGATTNTSLSCSPTSVSGQSPVVSSGATATVALDSSAAPAKQVVMGSTGNALAAYRFAETSNLENLKITDIIATDTMSGGTSSAFNNVTLSCTSCSGSPSAMASAASSTGSVFTYAFHFTTPIIVPQNGSVTLNLTGDVGTFTSLGSAADNITHHFDIGGSNVTALGQSSNASVTVTGSGVGATLTVLRSKLTVSGAAIGATSGRTRSAVDDIANLTFTSTGDASTVNTVTLKFQGQAVSTGTAQFNVSLIDPNTGTVWSGTTAQGCNPTAANSCSVSFTLTSAANTISAGTPKVVKVRVDSSSFYNSSNTSDSLSALIQNAADVNWGDQTTTAGLTLQATDVPVVLANISYE